MKLWLWLTYFLLTSAVFAEPMFTVGSKRFTESYILGEILQQTVQHVGEAKGIHKPGLGNTGIVFTALQQKAIDLYPEYTGTIDRELLKNATPTTLQAMNQKLAPLGLAVGIPLGFNDTYALAMREERATQLNIKSISDLVRHPELKLGLSQEFLGRADGWPGLQKAYALPFTRPRSLDHGLAYEAIAAGQLDVTDIYSTDAKIARYKLRTLVDDRNFFPSYQAVLLYRRDLPQRLPRTWQALRQLEGKISAEKMIAMNAQAELAGQSFATIAQGFLATTTVQPQQQTFWDKLFAPDLARLLGEHLWLVGCSLAAGIAVGIPLGIVAARTKALAQPILVVVGLIQTIPALALLAFLIPLLQQIGTLPALIALFLYALLPIVRNTYTGLLAIPTNLQTAALALGLPPLARLRLIELPLASPAILAGIKTSAVINVGTATIAAFIGAGGFGERIASGLALNDNDTLLSGAIPAALLAVVVQVGFEWLDRVVLPKGLRKT
jgi:osmoprotectant transport system permease protein